jgi:hypothetical protein
MGIKTGTFKEKLEIKTGSKDEKKYNFNFFRPA